ncbi:MAG TPA: hypothetical protein VK550_30345 [Polyangiaceae bacterium]|nr:hypothetical protein [Polyangiaceae bacterium]
MKNAMKLCCGAFALAALQCGGSPIDRSSGSAPEKTVSDTSAVVKMITPTRNADGTYTRTETVFTRQEWDAGMAAWTESARRFREGTHLAEAPAELGPVSCGTSPFDKLMIFQGGGFSGFACCLSGLGEGNIATMCGPSYSPLHSYRSTGRQGYYFNANESCYGTIAMYEDKEEIECDEAFNITLSWPQ